MRIRYKEFGIPAAFAFIESAQAELQAGEGVRDVSDERYEESLTVLRRYKLHVSDALLEAKEKLRSLLLQCAHWAKSHDADGQKEYAKTIRGLNNWIDRTKTIEELDHDAWTVRNFHEELDPSRPSAQSESASRPRQQSLTGA